MSRLSYPIIIGQIGIVLMGVADVMMIGRLDATNLAAVGLANSVYFLITILGVGTLTAISPLVAKAKGSGQTNDVALLFGQGLRAAVILGVLLTLVIFLLTLNLHWFGQTAEVTRLGKSFLHLLNTSTLFFMLFLASKQFSDGLSFTKPSAVITIAALILNVLLNWLLIYGNLGFPKMGLNGAGVATSISRFAMAVSMIAYVFTRKQYKPFLRAVVERSRAALLLKEIFVIGLPSGFQYLFEVGAFASAAIIIGWFGETQLAAHMIAINLASVTYMVATGLSAGGSIAVGGAIGRRNKTDMMRSGRAALILGAIFMGFCSIVFALFNKQLIGLYTHDAEVGHMASYLLLIAAFFQLSDGIQCVGLGVLRGLSDTRIPTLITIVAYWVIGIPIGYMLAYKFNLTLYGIWFGLSIGLLFSAVSLTIRFLKESKRVNVEELKDVEAHVF